MKNKIVYLDEVRLARKVIREVPDIINALDKSYDLLYNYSNYRNVKPVIEEMIDARIMLEIYLESYKMILKDYGIKV